MSIRAVSKTKNASVQQALETEQFRSLEIRIRMMKTYRGLLAMMTAPNDVPGQAALLEADLNISLAEQNLQSLKTPVATAGRPRA